MVADVERRKSRLMHLIEGIGTSGFSTAYVPAADATAYAQPASDDLRALIRSVIEETASACDAAWETMTALPALAVSSMTERIRARRSSLAGCA